MNVKNYKSTIQVLSDEKIIHVVYPKKKICSSNEKCDSEEDGEADTNNAKIRHAEGV